MIAVRNESDSSTIAMPSTTSGTHHHRPGSSWWPDRISSNLWYASYRANSPPTENSTIETMKA